MSPTGPAVVLMGLRGSGKTTIGRLLAADLGVPFVDLDDVTPSILGETTAADAINNRGLEAFRNAETEALRRELSTTAGVLALGGGTPTAPGARELLESCGVPCLYLHAGTDVLRARLSATDLGERPSLTGGAVLDEIGEIYLQRDTLYRELASHLVEVEDQEPEAVADAIAALLDSAPGVG
ncbi:MAG: shikimate kinase [Planctomycetota bacterium]